MATQGRDHQRRGIQEGRMRARLPAVAGRRLDLVRQLDLFSGLPALASMAQEGRPHRARPHPEWSYSWPVNRRVIYNRASVDRRVKPWNRKRRWCSGRTGNGSATCRTSLAPPAMQGGKLPFIMQPEGLGAHGPGLAEGPFPEHYEPMESPSRSIMSAQRVNPASIASARTRTRSPTHRPTSRW